MTYAGGGWGADTQLLMTDGSARAVQNIRVGDQLQGDDNAPRVVTALTTNVGPTYRIDCTSRGRPQCSWTCDGNQRLVLRMNLAPYVQRKNGQFKIRQFFALPPRCDLTLKCLPTIYPDQATANAALHTIKTTWRPLHLTYTVSDYMRRLTQQPKYYSSCMLYQSDFVDFPPHLPPIESLQQRLENIFGRTITPHDVESTAHTIGLWLTDGNSHQPYVYQIGTNWRRPHLDHTPVITALEDWFESMFGQLQLPITHLCSRTSALNDCFLVNLSDVARGGGASRFTRLLNTYGLVGHKHFPMSLLTELRNVRLALLGGVIDGDGCLNARSKCYIICSKSRGFIDGIVHLSRSLGYSVGVVQDTTKTIQGVQYHGYQIDIFGNHLSDIAPYIALPYKRCPTNAALGREPHNDQRCTPFKITSLRVRRRHYSVKVTGNNRCLLESFLVSTA